MTDLPDGPFNTPPGTTWRELDPPPSRRDDEQDDQFWREWFDRIIEREHEKEGLP